VGTEPIADFCRAIETYLTQKNEGHLIRVVGPSFDLVEGWAERGIPLKVAFEGIDRYFERYYRKGPRRRPVKIDFCEADVLDVFDEWRAALGLVAEAPGTAALGTEAPGTEAPGSAALGTEAPGTEAPGTEALDTAALGTEAPTTHHPPPNTQSLPAHLERVLRRLSEARAKGTLGDRFDALLDRVSAELDAARAKAGGLRGEARQALIDRLGALDAELVRGLQSMLDAQVLASLAREADQDLAAFRGGMTAETFARVRAAAIARRVRERAKMPIIAFT
jgi:hypothetical protein